MRRVLLQHDVGLCPGKRNCRYFSELQSRLKQANPCDAHRLPFEGRNLHGLLTETQHDVCILRNLHFLAGWWTLPDHRVHRQGTIYAIGHTQLQAARGKHVLRIRRRLPDQIGHAHDASANGDADGRHRAEKTRGGEDKYQNRDAQDAFQPFSPFLYGWMRDALAVFAVHDSVTVARHCGVLNPRPRGAPIPP